MRELTLLCLVGLTLAAALTKGDKVASENKEEPTKAFGYWTSLGNHDGFLPDPTGGNGVQDSPRYSTPMGNEDGFNTTTNSSTVPVVTSVNNETTQWNGTRERIDNNYGFPPSSAEGEDTKLTKGDKVASENTEESTQAFGIWTSLGNHDGFLPDPTGGNGVQDSPRYSTPMGNEDGFNTTTNSSTVPVVTSVNNETTQWNGTRERIDNNYGFPPSSAEGEDTKGNTKE